MRLAILSLGMLAACDPIWGVHVQLRDPANRPVDTATLAVACPYTSLYPTTAMSVRSSESGEASVVGMGFNFPPDCDVYVAKPGFRTQLIHYKDLCPDGPHGCQRNFMFELVLEPE